VVPGTLARIWPVMHAAAGRLMLGQGILPGADKPPTIILASFFNIILFFLFLIFFHLNVFLLWRLKLEACCLALAATTAKNSFGACGLTPDNIINSGRREPETLAYDLGAQALQLVELQDPINCVLVQYVAHFFLGSISFLTSRNISSIASAILFNCSTSIFPHFLYSSYNIPDPLSTLLGAFFIFFFFHNFLAQAPKRLGS
jgi:hypothetical protein